MIRVLVVDDEKMVRIGLVNFMPWKEFGMEVVGEANNGENALKFIENNKVDLLLTDLSMPVMSGIELMKEVSKHHPHIQVVVLTLHTDFEYVQEALRLGAIDYIAKTQLEKEQFEDVLGRIASLLDKKKLGVQQTEKSRVDQVYVVYMLNPHHDDPKWDASMPNDAVEVEMGVWYWRDLPPGVWTSSAGHALVCIRDLMELDRKAIVQLIRTYRRNGFFYDYDPARTLLDIRRDEIVNVGKDSGLDLNELKSKWLSPDWLYEDRIFEQMLQELKAVKLPPIRLTRLFFSLTDEWNRLYGQAMESPVAIEDSFHYFVQFGAWLSGAREAIRQANIKPQFSLEIQNSIAKATNLAQTMMNQSLTAGEMAQMVNMSSSYFSQCFKQIVGKTYTDYLRDIRMERAKHYLKNTARTIQWIAEQVGYNDDKYFSRLFREHVGVLPSDYRQESIHDRSH
ncbi:response regulator [Cohnella sp. GbtcB17]|uniref:response regulator transcription factor n=1 Tax=Cohnella sp. GbtcB17 TaxID=2824762 RepID=UPI001C2F306D|nr:response regulator [Cohnella sp. GbtcB17]